MPPVSTVTLVSEEQGGGRDQGGEQDHSQSQGRPRLPFNRLS